MSSNRANNYLVICAVKTPGALRGSAERGKEAREEKLR